jgi:ADP-heptose:LPS heptosyltransferase
MWIKFRRLLWSSLDYWLLDLLLLLIICRKKNGHLALVRLDAIGDFIIWLDSAKEYRRLYAEKRIVLIANAAWAGWAVNFPYWDEVWSFDSRRFKRNLFYRFQTLLKMRQAGFEIVIQPTYSRTFEGDSLIRVSGAAQRIGSIGDESNTSATVKALSNRWYTQLIPATERNLMELERNAEFIRNLSGLPYVAALPQLPERAVSARYVPSHNDYFVIFPGASWIGRQWSVENFAEVVSRLHAKLGWAIVMCGGPSDVMLCQQIGDKLTITYVNFAGKTSLPELAGLIARARLLITNETSAVHIAAALGTPAVCIVGGGHYGRFLPYPADMPGIKPLVADHKMPCFYCNWVCSERHDIAGPVPCIEKVSVQNVLDLISILIKS